VHVMLSIRGRREFGCVVEVIWKRHPIVGLRRYQGRQYLLYSELLITGHDIAMCASVSDFH
jgi:hypothetical protein